MALHTFPSQLVVDKATGRGVAGALGTVIDRLTGAPVDVLDSQGNPKQLLTNHDGYIEEFRTSDQHDIIEMTFGRVSLTSVALEIMQKASEAPAQLSALESKTSRIVVSANLFDKNQEMTPGSLLDDGTIDGNNTTRKTSGFIPVLPQSNYVWSTGGVALGTSNTGIVYLRYDSQFGVIGTRSVSGPFETTSQTAYIRVSALNELVDILQLEQGTVATPYMEFGSVEIPELTVERHGALDVALDAIGDRITDLESAPSVESVAEAVVNSSPKIAALESKTDYISISTNLFDKNQTWVTGHLNPDGTIDGTNPTRKTSDFIPVSPSSNYVWSTGGVALGTSDTGIVYQRFNSEFGLVSGQSVSGLFTTTSQTAYIRVSALNELIDALQLELGSTASPYMEYGSVEIPDLSVANHGLLSTELDTIQLRLSELESATPAPGSGAGETKTPDNLLDWEETPHTIRQLGTSYDGAIYVLSRTDADGTRLRRSYDSGTTFEASFSIAAVGGSVATFCVFADGSMVFISTTGAFYRVASFTGTPELIHQTTTGNTIHVLPTTFYDGPNGEKYVFAGEYDHTTTQKTMYYSKDGGLTYNILKQGDTLNAGNNHWHAVAYDPHSDGVWLSQGDGDNSRIYYTPDWGVTWSSVIGTHPTAIFAFKNRVVFGRDKTGEYPGMDYSFKTIDGPAPLRTAFDFRKDRSSFDYYPTRTSWNKSDDEHYMLFPARTVGDTDSRVYGTGDGGQSWHLLSSGPAVSINLTGMDANGYIFGKVKDGADDRLLRAKAPAWL